MKNEVAGGPAFSEKFKNTLKRLKMYKEWISRQTHGITKNDSYEAEPLEVKLRKATEEKKPIEAVAPMIYTEKSKGVSKYYSTAK